MTFWIVLWKTVFIISMAGFGILSVWVTIFGAMDIKSMLSTIQETHERGDE
ncbi:MAG: hypothetical protein JXR73_19250 [Candidatus Omnitrophica bacterium]|nr:hypothetical protein [Candidatus Omnitrophota bacterium]